MSLERKDEERMDLLSERVELVNQEPTLRVREMMLPTGQVTSLEYHQTAEGNLKLLVADQSESAVASLELLCKSLGLSLDRNGEVSHSPSILSTLPCVDIEQPSEKM